MTKLIKPKDSRYPNIERGASLTIPCRLQDTLSTPIDISDYTCHFTIKKAQYNYDYADDRAYVTKDFDPQQPTQGRLFVELSSHDLYFEPGEFFFDIELEHKNTGAIIRLCTLPFELVGGPTNRSVNTGIGQVAVGQQVTVVQLEQGRPIVIVAPFGLIDSNGGNGGGSWGYAADFGSTTAGDVVTIDLNDISPTVPQIAVGNELNDLSGTKAIVQAIVGNSVDVKILPPTAQFDPTPIWNAIGTLNSLNTTDKTNLVNAINEVVSQIGQIPTGTFVEIQPAASFTVPFESLQTTFDSLKAYVDGQVQIDIQAATTSGYQTAVLKNHSGNSEVFIKSTAAFPDAAIRFEDMLGPVRIFGLEMSFPSTTWSFATDCTKIDLVNVNFSSVDPVTPSTFSLYSSTIVASSCTFERVNFYLREESRLTLHGSTQYSGIITLEPGTILWISPTATFTGIIVNNGGMVVGGNYSQETFLRNDSQKVVNYDDHIANNYIHVTNLQKQEWSAKYDKPTTGIPPTDLDQPTQTLLDDAADHIANTDIHVTASQKTGWTAKYDKPSTGIPQTDLDTATSIIIDSSLIHIQDNDIHVTAAQKTGWTAKYDKPSTGIPQTDLSSAVQTILQDSEDHIADTTNPHNTTLSLAATAQSTNPTLLSGRLYLNSQSDGNKLLTQSEVLSLVGSAAGGLNYKGRLKYGAYTLADMNLIQTYTDNHDLDPGDLCGVHAEQKTYQWDGSAWVELQGSTDAVGDLYKIEFYYGTVDGVSYLGEVQAEIICQEITPTVVYDLFLDLTILLDDSATDSVIGPRTLVNATSSGRLDNSLTKYLTPRLQAIRNNMKAALSFRNTVNKLNRKFYEKEDWDFFATMEHDLEFPVYLTEIRFPVQSGAPVNEPFQIKFLRQYPDGFYDDQWIIYCDGNQCYVGPDTDPANGTVVFDSNGDLNPAYAAGLQPPVVDSDMQQWIYKDGNTNTNWSGWISVVGLYETKPLYWQNSIELYNPNQGDIDALDKVLKGTLAIGVTENSGVHTLTFDNFIGGEIQVYLMGVDWVNASLYAANTSSKFSVFVQGGTNSGGNISVSNCSNFSFSSDVIWNNGINLDNSTAHVNVQAIAATVIVSNSELYLSEVGSINSTILSNGKLYINNNVSESADFHITKTDSSFVFDERDQKAQDSFVRTSLIEIPMPTTSGKTLADYFSLTNSNSINFSLSVPTSPTYKFTDMPLGNTGQTYVMTVYHPQNSQDELIVVATDQNNSVQVGRKSTTDTLLTWSYIYGGNIDFGPDYANISSTNLLPALASSATITDDGYVIWAMRSTDGGTAQWPVWHQLIINGKTIINNWINGSFEYSYQLVPVTKGDIITQNANPTTSYLEDSQYSYCYFIPKKIQSVTLPVNVVNSLQFLPQIDYRNVTRVVNKPTFSSAPASQTPVLLYTTTVDAWYRIWGSVESINSKSGTQYIKQYYMYKMSFNVNPQQLSGHTSVSSLANQNWLYQEYIEWVYFPAGTGIYVCFEYSSGCTINASNINQYIDRYMPKVIPPVYVEGQPLINYSLTEQDTGFKWIDGRPIYQRTFVCSLPATNVSSAGGQAQVIPSPQPQLPVGSQIIKAYTRATAGSGTTQDLSFIFWGIQTTGLLSGGTGITIGVYSSPVYITVQYVK